MTKHMSIDRAGKMKGATWALVALLGLLLGPIGAFSAAQPAFAQTAADCPRPASVQVNPLATPSTTASEVVAGTGDLGDFALAARAYLDSITTPDELGYAGCTTRNEGPWKSGNIYLSAVSLDGRVFWNNDDMATGGRKLTDQVYGAILAVLGFDVQNPAGLPGQFSTVIQTRMFPNPNGGYLPGGGYAVGYGTTFPYILLAGLHIDESILVDETLPTGDPALSAAQVVDRATLRRFVEGAISYLQELGETQPTEVIGIARNVLRKPPWKHGPIYLFLMDPNGYTHLHAGFPDKFEFQKPTDTLRDEVTGELILPQIIAAAQQPGGGFVRYYFDNPDDQSDSADVPKVTYARQVTFTLDIPGFGEITSSYIVGAGIYGDPQPQESSAGAKNWLAHFGRAVASQAVEMISNRMTAPSSDASQVTLAGQSMHRDSSALAESSSLLDPGDPAGWQTTDPWPAQEDPGAGYRTMSLSDVLLNSSFRLALTNGDADAAGGRWTAWGRGGLTRFASDEGVSVDGNVTTGMLGVDYEQGRMLTGIAVSHARGEGDYALAGARTDVTATLNSVHPHLRYAMSEQLSVWGILGLGQGEMTLEDVASATTVETGIDMSMAALGVRGEILSAAAGDGLDLALKSDAMLTRTTADAKDGLASISAGTMRLRAMLEGSSEMALESGASLRPSVEAGLRHDSGDAEEGAGVEIGGRIVYTDPSWGLTVEAGGRTLVAHQESDSREWGLDGSVRLDPGAQGRGLSFTMGSTWGAASSDLERLWAQRSVANLASGNEEPVAGFGAEVGYGFSAPGLGLLTPYGGLAVSNRGTETYRAGGRLDIGGSFRVSLEGDRRERIHGDPEHGVMLRGALRW